MARPLTLQGEVLADETDQLLITQVEPDSTFRVLYMDEYDGNQLLLSEVVPDEEIRLTFDTAGAYRIEVDISNVPGGPTHVWSTEIDAV